MERLTNFLALLRARLWVLPALMSLFGVALAYFLLRSPEFWANLGASKLWWLYSGDAGSARELLGVLLSGTITMTSLVVSLTFVTLTLAASQLGPRLISSFIADREIQSVLGLFLATILYIIIVMRTVGDELGAKGVPHLAITVASVLIIACMFALLFYVHKISRAIIADTVVENVSNELEEAISNILPKDAGPKLEEEPTELPPIQRFVSLEQAGYVQVIDYGSLIAWAREHRAVLRIRIKAGDFLLRCGRHIDVMAPQHLEESLTDELKGSIVIGSERSPAQDLEFSIRQLVEVALRALSPGINDPFTAVAVIDRLGASLELIIKYGPLPRMMFDKDSSLRALVARSDVQSLAETCFGQIRHAASKNPAVIMYLADTFGKLAESCRTEAAHDLLRHHLDRLEHALEKECAKDEQSPVRAGIGRAKALCKPNFEPEAEGQG